MTALHLWNHLCYRLISTCTCATSWRRGSKWRGNWKFCQWELRAPTLELRLKERPEERAGSSSVSGPAWSNLQTSSTVKYWTKLLCERSHCWTFLCHNEYFPTKLSYRSGIVGSCAVTGVSRQSCQRRPACEECNLPITGDIWKQAQQDFWAEQQIIILLQSPGGSCTRNSAFVIVTGR